MYKNDYRQDIRTTFDLLDGKFQFPQNGRLCIDPDFVRQSIMYHIDNTESIIEGEIVKSNRKIEAIVFYSFVDWVNEELRSEVGRFKTSNYQIKKWLGKYGYDFKSFLAPLVSSYKEYRNERRAEV